MTQTDLLELDADIRKIYGTDLPIKQIRLPQELLENSLCFVKSAKFLEKLQKITDAKALLTSTILLDEKFHSTLTEEQNTWLEKSVGQILVSKKFALSMCKISKPFYDEKFAQMNHSVDGRQLGTVDIHPTGLISQGVFIGEHVTIGKHVTIMPGVVIMSNVKIGDHTMIYPNVSIYPFTTIGSRVRIHSNTTIGSDGYGYHFDQGIHHKIWHTGGVQIDNDVEIGSNVSIDMGAFTTTHIGAGTKIDNLVQIAHNVKIGKGCILCGDSGVSGSAVLEDYVVLGGKAGVGPDAHLGMGTQVAGAGMVNESALWPAGSKIGGHPARDLKEWMRGFAYVRKMSLK